MKKVITATLLLSACATNEGTPPATNGNEGSTSSSGSAPASTLVGWWGLRGGVRRRAPCGTRPGCGPPVGSAG